VEGGRKSRRRGAKRATTCLDFDLVVKGGHGEELGSCIVFEGVQMSMGGLLEGVQERESVCV